MPPRVFLPMDLAPSSHRRPRPSFCVPDAQLYLAETDSQRVAACVAVRLSEGENKEIVLLEAIVPTPEVENLGVLWDELFDRVLEDYSEHRIFVQLVEDMLCNTHFKRALEARHQGLKLVRCSSTGPPRVELSEVVPLDEMDEEDEGGHRAREERGERRKKGKGRAAAGTAQVKEEQVA